MGSILTDEELQTLNPEDRKDALELQAKIDAQDQAAQQADETPAAPLADPNTDQPAPAAEPTPVDDGGTPASEPAPTEAQPNKQVVIDQEELDRIKAELELIKHKHDVVKGKYDAEIKPKNLELQQKRARIEELERLVRTQTAPPEPAATSTMTEPPSFDLSEEERFALGESGLSAVQKINAKYASEIKRLHELERQSTMAEVEKLRKQSEEARFGLFDRELTSLVGDFGATYGDPDFQTWLNEPDELSGETRKTLYDRALVNMNAPQVAKFHAKFEKDVKPAAAPPAPAASIESQVTPRSVGTAPVIVPATPAKPTYALKDWFALMEEVPMLRLNGKSITPEKAREMIAELEAAERERRVK